MRIPSTSHTRRRFLATAVGLLGCTLTSCATSRSRTAANLTPLPRSAKLRLAWLPKVTCVAPVAVAAELGFFAAQNLDVEQIAYDFHTPEMLRSPVSGASDAAVTMIHNWLLPIRDGLNVRLITPIHGGCVRIVGSRAASVIDVASLRGKTIGIAGGEVGELARMVFAIVLVQNGLDPNRDVSWEAFPDEQFGAALRAGRIQAAGGIDPPLVALQREMPDLVEIASNMTGPMLGRSCCVVAAGPRLWRDEPEVAAALVRALNQASEYTAAHPEQAAALFARRSKLEQGDIVTALRAMNNHAHHPSPSLHRDVMLYARDLQRIGVFPAGLDPEAFADQAVWMNSSPSLTPAARVPGAGRPTPRSV